MVLIGISPRVSDAECLACACWPKLLFHGYRALLPQHEKVLETDGHRIKSVLNVTEVFT